MGTRGLYGFRKNGVDKVTYNHWDSYPDGLGKQILRFINKYGMELNKIYDKIILVDENSVPTEEQVTECQEFIDTSVSEQSTKDWYCLLYKSFGNPESYAYDLRYMINNISFIHDSLFCEYGYIINLDTNKLEIWRGFQHLPDPNNRYGAEPYQDEYMAEPYYPCSCVKEIDLIDIVKANEDGLDDIIVEIKNATEIA